MMYVFCYQLYCTFSFQTSRSSVSPKCTETPGDNYEVSYTASPLISYTKRYGVASVSRYVTILDADS